MSASWYSLLGVAPSASTDEIRAAWKSAIAELEPGDRLFRLYNEAAEVLLDPERRAAYDAEQGAMAPEVVPDERIADDVVEDDADEDDTLDGVDEDDADQPGAPAYADDRTPWVPAGWLLAALALSTAILAGTAAWLTFTGEDAADVEESISQARQAAERAVPLVLSYDYQTLERDHDRARRVLTGEQLREYDKNWKEAIEPNAAKVKGSVASTVPAGGIGVVTASDDGDKVELVVVVDSQSSNANVANRQTLALTVVMVEKDGEWLISDLGQGS